MSEPILLDFSRNQVKVSERAAGLLWVGERC
jgi:hypothetical protein